MVFIYLINLFISLLTGNNEILSLQLSTFIGQILILSFGTSIILSTFSKLADLKWFEKLLFHSIVLSSPLIKYALFDLSHQTLTYLNIVFMIYVLKNYESINYSKLTIFLGILFLAHSHSYLFSFYLFSISNKIKINLKNLILGLKGSIYVLLPYLAYRLVIFSLGYEIYDGLTKKWGQFIWIYDFIRGKVRYASDWHCVTVPENFICYFQDTSSTLLYLLILYYLL